MAFLLHWFQINNFIILNYSVAHDFLLIFLTINIELSIAIAQIVIRKNLLYFAISSSHKHK